MKNYTIEVKESFEEPKKKEQTYKPNSFSWGALLLAILATFILFPKSIDTVNEYFKQQKECYNLEQKKNENTNSF